MKTKNRMFRIVQGFIEILEGIITVVTLAYYIPSWSLQWCLFYSKIEAKEGYIE